MVRTWVNRLDVSGIHHGVKAGYDASSRAKQQGRAAMQSDGSVQQQYKAAGQRHSTQQQCRAAMPGEQLKRCCRAATAYTGEVHSSSNMLAASRGHLRQLLLCLLLSCFQGLLVGFHRLLLLHKVLLAFVIMRSGVGICIEVQIQFYLECKCQSPDGFCLFFS